MSHPRPTLKGTAESFNKWSNYKSWMMLTRLVWVGWEAEEHTEAFRVGNDIFMKSIFYHQTHWQETSNCCSKKIWLVISKGGSQVLHPIAAKFDFLGSSFNQLFLQMEKLNESNISRKGSSCLVSMKVDQKQIETSRLYDWWTLFDPLTPPQSISMQTVGKKTLRDE